MATDGLKNPHLATHPHGYFADPETMLPTRGPVVTATWCRDGSRDMILTKPVVSVDPKGREHRAPVGFRTNGLSAWRVCWRLVSPFEPLSREASVIHDWLCWIGWDWNDAAWVFYHAMRANGIGPVRAWIRWAAVRFIGKRFQGRHR